MTEQEDDLRAAVSGFRAGDEQALAEAYGRWSPLVYSLALQLLEDVTDAEQVTWRVFTQAWTSRDRFDDVPLSLSAWLVGLTRLEVARAQGQPSAPSDPAAAASDARAEPADLADRLLLADEVSHLDAEPQEVLRMALYGRLSHAQIAERLGLPPVTVANHIRRSLLALRARLEVQQHAC